MRNTIHAWAKQRWLSSVLCCTCHDVLRTAQSRQKPRQRNLDGPGRAVWSSQRTPGRTLLTLARLVECNCCDRGEKCDCHEDSDTCSKNGS